MMRIALMERPQATEIVSGDETSHEILRIYRIEKGQLEEPPGEKRSAGGAAEGRVPARVRVAASRRNATGGVCPARRIRGVVAIGPGQSRAIAADLLAV